MNWTRADRASIEAEIATELARVGLDCDLEALATRVASRLGVDVQSCLTIARARLALASLEEPPQHIAPGKLPRHLIERRPLAKGPVAPGKRSVTHDSFYRTRVASSTPGKQTLTSMLPQASPRTAINSVDELRALLGFDLVPEEQTVEPSARKRQLSRDESVATPVQSQNGAHAAREPFCAPLSATSSLAAGLLSEIGERSGKDVSGVRFHTGTDAVMSAEAINARAYATGHDVYFGAGEFRPDTEEGRELIAHEVAHTIQFAGQASVPVQQPRWPKPVFKNDASVESAADAFASAFTRGAALPHLSRAEGVGLARRLQPSRPNAITC